MPLLARTVLAPLAVDVSAGALARLPELLVDTRISSGGKVAVALGPGIGAEIAEKLDLPDAIIHTIQPGTLDSAHHLAALLRDDRVDALVGIGGGRLIDTAKYTATQLGLPMVSVATSLAHDGIASPTASLTREGVSISYGVHTPLAVLADLDYIRRAPASQLQSGVGDALTNLSAVADWELSHQVNGESVDGLAAAVARSGAEAVLRHPGTIADDAFLTTLANALVQGGLAMGMAGSSRPCSGGCHEISHALDVLHPGLAQHGQQGALGALFCTWVRGDKVLFAELAAAMKRHGLPRTASELGLSTDELSIAIEYAPRTRPGRYTILEHRELDSVAISRHLAEMMHELD
ncbi:iron-containing alcohol dehydrogenase family protein [Glycomyces buryatensis]|uniref:Iron-containing alcohol dehydrogenase family protein n=1 Tax=Glycomyces buryatensis TaxID=2570927 RepID=A0A4S8QFR2_9ACTN|nr:iron-containing alcohol dehydrogenase family protein [Glycomyces buryatensis]THV43473.1 iron-containing alcohol dehydrogenase family protein [Glycomyces buryatensis]